MDKSMEDIGEIHVGADGPNLERDEALRIAEEIHGFQFAALGVQGDEGSHNEMPSGQTWGELVEGHLE